MDYHLQKTFFVFFNYNTIAYCHQGTKIFFYSSSLLALSALRPALFGNLRDQILHEDEDQNESADDDARPP